MKKVTPMVLATLLLFPAITQAETLGTFFTSFTQFLNDIVIPFLLGIAFLFFVINAFRFFIVGGSNEEGRDKAKALAIYSVSAFVLIIVFWGIINMFSQFLGFGGDTQPESDYMCPDGLCPDYMKPEQFDQPFGNDPCDIDPNNQNCLDNANTG